MYTKAITTDSSNAKKFSLTQFQQSSKTIRLNSLPTTVSQVITEVQEKVTEESGYLEYLKGKEEEVQTLLRFIKAANYNVDLAVNNLKTCWGLRKKYKPEQLRATDVFLLKSSWVKKGVGVFGGFDKEMRPSVIIFPALHDNKSDSRKQFHTGKKEKRGTTWRGKVPEVPKGEIKTLFWVIESLISKMPTGVDQFVVIFDFTGAGFSRNWDNAMVEFLKLLYICYPQRVGHIVVINTNVMWDVAYRYLKSCGSGVPKSLKPKLTLVRGNKTWRIRLFSLFSRSQLPVEYGGVLTGILSSQQREILSISGRISQPNGPTPRSLVSSALKSSNDLFGDVKTGKIYQPIKKSKDENFNDRGSTPVLELSKHDQNAKEKEVEKEEKGKDKDKQEEKESEHKSGFTEKKKGYKRKEYDKKSCKEVETKKLETGRRSNSASLSRTKSKEKDKLKTKKEKEKEKEKEEREKDQKPGFTERNKPYKSMTTKLSRKKPILTKAQTKRSKSVMPTERVKMRSTTLSNKLADSPSMIIDSRDREKYPWEVDYSELTFLDELVYGEDCGTFVMEWRNGQSLLCTLAWISCCCQEVESC